MRISDWSSDVCSSDLAAGERALALLQGDDGPAQVRHDFPERDHFRVDALAGDRLIAPIEGVARRDAAGLQLRVGIAPAGGARSEGRRVGKEGGSTCRSRWSPYN